jgi:hypothetical protein
MEEKMRRFAGSSVAVGALALLATAGGVWPARAQDAKKSGPPTLKSAWKMDLPTGTQRVAVADVTDDKRPRLLVLDGEGTLSVQKLSDTAAEKEASIPLGAGAARFVAGHFAKDRPAVIAVPGAVYYRDGDKYSKKAAADLTEVTGSVRFPDGREFIFVFTEGSPPVSYSVDLSADKPLKGGPEVPEPDAKAGQFREIVAYLPQEIFDHGPFPDEVKKGAIARLFDPHSENRLYGVLAWQATDGAYVVVVDGADLFPEPKADMKPTWKSPKLAGKVLDIALGPDPKGSKQTGVFVLQAAGDDGKGRVLEFFALE